MPLFARSSARLGVPFSILPAAVLALALGACGGGGNDTDAGPPDGGGGSDASMVVNGPVDLSGTFIAAGKISVLVSTLPDSVLVPTQVLESVQVTLTRYVQNGTTLTEDTTLCGVDLPLPRIIDAGNPSSARVGLRFGDDLQAYLDAGNITVTDMGDFVSGTEIAGGVPLAYTGGRAVFVLGARFDPGADAETAPLPAMNIASDGMGGEIVTISEPPGSYWDDTEGDVCPGLIIDGMMAGDPCPGVTVLFTGDVSNPAIASLLPQSGQVAIRVAFTLTGSVYSSNLLGGAVGNPVNDQELIGFTLEAGQTLTASMVEMNLPRVEICNTQPECVAVGAASTWMSVRVDGTNGSASADTDGDGTVTCPEALPFVDDNPALFGL